MNFSASIDSRERETFLESTQDTLREHLELEPVIEALGKQAVAHISMLSNLLIPPLIEDDGRAYIPPAQKLRDAIPFVALKYGETITFSGESLLPCPAQLRSAKRQLEAWSGYDETGVFGLQNAMVDQIDAGLSRTIQFKLPYNDTHGIVVSRGVGVDGAKIADKGVVPNVFGHRLRPALGLRFGRGYSASESLVHELMHVDWSIRHPIMTPDKKVSAKELCQNELRAHHFAAVYAGGVLATQSKAAQLWKTPETAHKNTVENIRKKYADPEKPFDPTPEMIEALQKRGVKWAKS